MRVFLILLLISGFVNASGQDCSVCNEALRKDVLKYKYNFYLYSKYFEEITEKEYEELKHDFSAIAAIPVPELKAIVQESLTYSDFKKRTHDFNLKIESENISLKNIDYTVTRTNPTAYPSWDNCMSNCFGKLGLFIFRTNDAVETGSFKVRYVGAVEEPDVMQLSFEIRSEGKVTKVTKAIRKGGVASFQYDRTFKKNKSETTITVNASREVDGPVAYSDEMKSVYIKPTGITVTSLNYTYTTQVSKIERGLPVQNCMNPSTPPGGHRDGGTTRNGFRQVDNPPCPNRPVARSCDNKFSGYLNIIEVAASEGYYFKSSFNPVPNADLKLEGPMAAWNASHRCHDNILVNDINLKRMVLWLHQNVSAHLEVTSFKDETNTDSAFPSVDENGDVSFSIPTERLTSKYNISVALSNGNLIIITPENVNTLAYLNNIENKTKFTLKRVAAFTGAQRRVTAILR